MRKKTVNYPLLGRFLEKLKDTNISNTYGFTDIAKELDISLDDVLKLVGWSNNYLRISISYKNTWGRIYISSKRWHSLTQEERNEIIQRCKTWN